MDIPNAITGSRFVLAGVGCVALLWGFPYHVTVATVIFVVAAASDWLDGYLARSHGRFSAFGTFLDPLADKVLVLEYFAYLLVVGVYPLWLFMAMLARDLVHDAYRSYAASMKISLPANSLSKAKTALQLLSLTLALLALSLGEFGVADEIPALGQAAEWSMIVALVLGLLGMGKSAMNQRRLFFTGE